MKKAFISDLSVAEDMRKTKRDRKARQGGLLVMKKTKISGFTIKMIIIIVAMLLATNILLGVILVGNSRTTMKTLIDNRMLDIANTAAAMLNGDELEQLKKEDKGTPPYQRVNDVLAVFQDNIDLKYIYCISDAGNGNFVFSVDPTIEDPGEFGEPIVPTEALNKASKGSPAVDVEPYEDAWGKFYSAYSPVFDSQGNVAGIVAVDFSADWYEERIYTQTYIIIINCIVAVLVGTFLVIFATRQMRRRIQDVMDEIADVAEDVDELTRVINPDAVIDTTQDEERDEVLELGRRIHGIREGLHSYTSNLHTQANSMITALSSEYRGVYYVDLDSDEGICYQPHTQIDGLRQGEHFRYIDTLQEYADKYVTDKYKESFIEFAAPDAVRKALETERIITIRYMINSNGQESYEMLRMAGVRHPEDREDHIVHAIGMGFADVDAETRATLNQSQALSDALNDAEIANKAKTAFLSSMSHEIRTPMNAIIGIDKLALSNPDISDTTREQLEKIGTSAEHLLGIINDILDMSRIEAGRMTIRSEVFSLPTLIEQVDIMIGGQCRDKGIDWHWEMLSEADNYYEGDDVKLKQVIINILGNSVKFTPQGGKISFTIERINRYDSKSTFRFVMTDNGIGMDEDYLPKLFEPFSQEDSSTKTKYGSTGLGMPITKSIVELMNGEIKVDSKKGVGTTFTVTITLADSSEQAAEESKEDVIDRVSLGGRRILLAEDMEINAEIMKEILGSEEMLVEHAEDGRQALEMFSASDENYFDAILMDMRMPNMDGLEATKAIRGLDREDAKTIPIIALTANAFNEDVERSLQAGLDAHLSKPVDADMLFDTLAKLM